MVGSNEPDTGKTGSAAGECSAASQENTPASRRLGKAATCVTRSRNSAQMASPSRPTAHDDDVWPCGDAYGWNMHFATNHVGGRRRRDHKNQRQYKVARAKSAESAEAVRKRYCRCIGDRHWVALAFFTSPGF